MKTELTAIQNAVADLDGKADGMQLAIDHARENRRDLRMLMGTHDDHLRELCRDLRAAEVEATNVKVAVRDCELAWKAESGRLEEVVAENCRLFDAHQGHAEQQDQLIEELRIAADVESGRLNDPAAEKRRLSDRLRNWKMLTYFISGVFLAFLAWIMY